MSKLLTIVIPCYNTEQYLAECLESILFSEYNDTLEVLAINDGSKDNTLSVAREYEARFPEILKVIDKPNGGWGTVINMAIKEAKGRYFKILDSDDWFDKTAYAEFISLLKKCDADIFITNYTEIYKDRTIEGRKYAEHLCYHTMEIEEYLAKEKTPSLFPMTNISVKTDILKEGNFTLPDRYYGDICFFIYTMALSNSVYITNLNLYQYRKTVDGQSTSINGYIRNHKDYIEIVSKLVNFYAIFPLTHYKRTVIKSNLIRNISFAYKLLMSKEYCGNMPESKVLLNEYNSYLKQTSKELYKESYKITNKHIPYVLIWRIFNINLFKLR